GKIRASISNEWPGEHSIWNVAGTASGISLAQTSEALGFTDRLGGSLRACNFTFRGDPRDPMLGTASVWTELNGLGWNNRAAHAISQARSQSKGRSTPGSAKSADSLPPAETRCPYLRDRSTG